MAVKQAVQILDHRQVMQKIHRLSVEIIEHNHDVDHLYLVGINNNGFAFASLLVDQLRDQKFFTAHLQQVRLNPANPTGSVIETDLPVSDLNNCRIILVDDVANTGRTLFFAMKPFLTITPERLELAVLVDRKHKSFPIRPDYVGISIATTLLQHIDVCLDAGKMAVKME